MSAPFEPRGRKEVPMASSLKARISRLLDKLEQGYLPEEEERAIRRKIKFLRRLDAEDPQS